MHIRKDRWQGETLLGKIGPKPTQEWRPLRVIWSDSCTFCSWFRQHNPAVLRTHAWYRCVGEQQGYAVEITNERYTSQKPDNTQQSSFSSCPKNAGQFGNHAPHKLMWDALFPNGWRIGSLNILKHVTYMNIIIQTSDHILYMNIHEPEDERGRAERSTFDGKKSAASSVSTNSLLKRK